jgi:hypothetical protein
MDAGYLAYPEESSPSNHLESCFTNIPEDVFVKIASYLRVRDIMSLRLVSPFFPRCLQVNWSSTYPFTFEGQQMGQRDDPFTSALGTVCSYKSSRQGNTLAFLRNSLIITSNSHHRTPRHSRPSNQEELDKQRHQAH